MLTSKTCFRFIYFLLFQKHKKFRWPLLYQFLLRLHLFQHLWNQTKWGWALWWTHGKASIVAKDENICLFHIAKEATLNKQRGNSCVPFISVLISLHIERFSVSRTQDFYIIHAFCCGYQIVKVHALLYKFSWPK